MPKPTLLLSLFAAATLCANPISIEKIVINENPEDESLFLEDANLSKPENKERFSAKSIKTLSTHANMNPYTVIAYSPSVHFTPVDAAGSNEPSFHDPIRIRAKSQTGPGGVYMINSMPISSNPGGGKQMLDMENVASIDLLKGYLPVDKNLGFSSLIGKVDMQVKEAQKKAAANISQSFGSYGFQRTYLRFDTGKIGDFTAFGSYSILSNEKYKGEGGLKRANFMAGITYEQNSKLKASLYAIHNQNESNEYGYLNYNETKDLKNNFHKDFATTKPTTANDVDFYDWNKQDFDTTNVFADILYKPTSSDTIVFKPYYKQDKGELFFSNYGATPAQNRVINWRMDHDVYGAVTSYTHSFSKALNAKLGYNIHKQLPPGPPTNRRAYKVNAAGDLEFVKYAQLAEVEHHTISAPFVELSGGIDKFVYSAGLQHQEFRLSSITSYNSNATTSQDYNTALATSTVDDRASVSAKSFTTWLPSLYVAYNFNSKNSLFVDYTRTYGFDVNLYPTYTASAPLRAATPLQNLWNQHELETSDNIDLGHKTTIGAITLQPTLFVSFVKNKQANVYDNAVGVAYPANLGDALGYGAELSSYGLLSDDLEFMTGLSYNHYSFSENFQSSATNIAQIKGNQLPDAPEYMAKGALSYSLDKWTFTPSARYTSSRYGDVENKQKIDAFTVFDFDTSYKASSFMGSQSTLFRATISNLTNEQYISTIITPDNALTSTNTASSYQTGAPRMIFFSANLRY